MSASDKAVEYMLAIFDKGEVLYDSSSLMKKISCEKLDDLIDKYKEWDLATHHESRIKIASGNNKKAKEKKRKAKLNTTIRKKALDSYINELMLLLL